MLGRTLGVRRGGARRARGHGGVRVRLGRQPAARDRPARRRPGAAAGVWERAHGDPHQRHRSGVARRPGRAARRDAPTRSTSAARSTTRPRRCCTARCTCRRRSRRATATPWRTSSSHLIEAAGGRTWRCSRAGRRSTTPRPPCASGSRCRSSPSATCPSRRWSAAFAESDETCLFATTGLFQGVDVPGSHAVAGRHRQAAVPAARRPAAVGSARAARRGGVRRRSTCRGRRRCWPRRAGRLIRTADDRGVVAVLDPRLGTARYRWDIVKALPPMRRTRDRAEVEAFLRDLRT